MSDANSMTTLVAIVQFSKMTEKLYLYTVLARSSLSPANHRYPKKCCFALDTTVLYVRLNASTASSRVNSFATIFVSPSSTALERI